MAGREGKPVPNSKRNREIPNSEVNRHVRSRNLDDGQQNLIDL